MFTLTGLEFIKPVDQILFLLIFNWFLSLVQQKEVEIIFKVL